MSKNAGGEHATGGCPRHLRRLSGRGGRGRGKLMSEQVEESDGEHKICISLRVLCKERC